MIHKKIIKLTCTLLAIPGMITAQGWFPLYQGEISNYRKTGESIICSNIWTDSLQTDLGDTVYYLNRVFKDCGSYVVINLPVFLQRELHSTDSTFLFQSPNNYMVPKQISPGDEWIFDTLHNISASLLQVIWDTVFGTADSLRIILLNSNDGNPQDTLIMSKDHGIVQFPDFEEPGKNYLLAGFENRGVGLQMPGMMEFYDFQAGDRFQYQRKYESYGHGSGMIRTTISLYDITDVDKDTNAITYHKTGLWKETIRQWDPGFGLDTTYYEYGIIDEDDTIVFDPMSWMNKYIGQVIPYGNHGDFNLLTYQMSPEFNKPMKAKDLRLFGGAGDTVYSQMPYPVSPANVCAGLGQTYYYYEPYGWDYRVTLNLQAYIKGEETYGSFASFCGLLDPEIKATMGFPVQDTILSIYDQLVLTLPDYFDSYLWSDGSDSNALVIRGNDYGTGDHQITVETSYYNCSLSDTINVKVIDNSGIIDEPPIDIQYDSDGCFVIKNISFAKLDYRVTLLDGGGRLVADKNYPGQLPGSVIHHCINDISSGFYILSVNTGGKTYTRKITR